MSRAAPQLALWAYLRQHASLTMKRSQVVDSIPGSPTGFVPGLLWRVNKCPWEVQAVVGNILGIQGWKLNPMQRKNLTQSQQPLLHNLNRSFRLSSTLSCTLWHKRQVLLLRGPVSGLEYLGLKCRRTRRQEMSHMTPINMFDQTIIVP